MRNIKNIALATIAIGCLYSYNANAAGGFGTNGPSIPFFVTDTEKNEQVDVGLWSAQGLGISGQLATTSTITAGAGVNAGYDGQACTMSIQGEQRYNKAANQPEYCNGSAWVTFGGSPSGTLCGFMITGLFDQFPIWGGTPEEGCNGVQLPNCPVGYTLRNMSGGLMNLFYDEHTCMKN